MSLYGEKGIVLGPVIPKGGIEVDKARTNLIVSLQPRTYVKEVRYFFQHVGFYHRFIKDFGNIPKPLTSLLAKNVPFQFSEECFVAFTKLKEVLTSLPILHPPVIKEPFELICDASDYTIGVILGQLIDKKSCVFIILGTL